MPLKKKNAVNEDITRLFCPSLSESAEEKMSCSLSFPRELMQKTPQELIHELQVHQIELEMQAEELKATQITLAHSRDQYHDLYEFAPLGYLTISHEGIIVQANLTAASLLQIERNTLVGSVFRRWVVSQDLEAWDSFFCSFLTHGKPSTILIHLKQGKTGFFPARLECLRTNGIDKEDVIRISLSDISDLHEIASALHTSDERFHLALRNAPVSITIQDKDLIYQWAYNQHTIHLKNIIGKKDTDLFAPDIAHHLIERKREVLHDGKKIREKLWVTLHESRFYLDMYLEPLHDDRGNISGIGVAIVDLTEQKNNEEALQRSEETLQQAQELLESVTKGTDVIIAVQDTQYRD